MARALTVGLVLCAWLAASPARADGNGRTRVHREEGRAAQVVASCGGYDVVVRYGYEAVIRNHYSAEGRLLRQVYEARWFDRVLYNSERPELFFTNPASSTGNHKVELDLVTWTMTVTGGNGRTVLPGAGAITMETGRWIMDLASGALLVDTGRDDDGAAEVAALCALVAP